MTQAQTRTTYRLNLLTLEGQLSKTKGEYGPDCLSVEAAKATKRISSASAATIRRKVGQTIVADESGDRQLAVEATSWRLGGDGLWRETGSVIAEVL